MYHISYRFPTSLRTLRLVPLLLGLMPSLSALDVSVVSYQTKGDGKADDTNAIQKAIEACADAGGGIVTVPAGTYLVGGLKLRANITLNLEKGATILGSPSLAVYKLHGNEHFLTATRADKITIKGQGTLDGNGKSYWVEDVNYVWDKDLWKETAHDAWTNTDRPANLFFDECTNLTIQDVRIVNSPTWTVHIRGSTKVTIQGITIDNPLYGPNTDGIDLDRCQDVLVNNCDISTGDDGVVLKSRGGKTGRLSSNITVSNCRIQSTCQALKIGTETQGDFKNITFTDCTVYNTSNDPRYRAAAGVAIETVDGGDVDTVHVKNITMNNVRAPLFVRLGNRGTGQDTTVKIPGHLTNVTVEGITATKSLLESSITGIPGARVDGITLRNIAIECEGGGLASWATVAVPERITSYPRPQMFDIRLPASGLYCRHVKGLVLETLAFSQLAPDGRPTVVFDDVVDATNTPVQAPVIVSGAPGVDVAASAVIDPVARTTARVSVLGKDDGGEPALKYTWSVLGTPPAPVGFAPNASNAAKNAVATFRQAGTYTLQVAITDAQNLTTRSDVAVQVVQALSAVTLSPATTALAVGQSQGFSASGVDQFGTSMAVAPAWSVTGGGTISAAGVFTAGTAGGPFTISGTSGSRTGTATVTVTAPINTAPVVSSVTAASLVNGTSTSLSVVANDDRGEAALTYRWSTTGTPPDPVTFSANGTNAAKSVTASFTKAGTYAFQVVATDAAGLTASRGVTVTVAQNLASVSLAPTTLSVAVGQTQAFSAAGLDQFGKPMAVTPAWSVTGGGTISAAGVFTAGTAGGPFTVSGSASSRTGSATVTVTAPVNTAPAVVTAAAATANPVLGNATDLTVQAKDDNGEAALTYTWSTTGTPPAPVSFSVNGTNGAKTVRATFAKAGSYALQVAIADAAGKVTTSTMTLTVAQSLASMTVTPTTASVVVGRTRAFLAAGVDQFGDVMPVTPTWTVTGGGTISADGMFTASTLGGPFTVSGSANGRSVTAAVTVTSNTGPKVVTAATAAASPVLGTSTSLSVVANDDSGEPALTYKWSTTGTPPAAVTFSANGTNAAKTVTATFTKPGIYGFRVLITDPDGVAAQSPVTVTVAPALTTLTVRSSASSVVAGQALTLSAAGLDQFGVAMAGTATDPLSWAPTRQWVVSSGTAANVAIAQANALTTGVSFRAPGIYGLKLRVTDDRSRIIESQEVLVMVGININFQPASAVIPAGYLADTGAIYGARNGLTYGWDADISADTRKRNVNADPVLDTFIHLAKTGSRTWQIALPSGFYEVDIDAGDPSYQDMTNSFEVEGQQKLDPTPQASNYDRYTVIVQVVDGKLTIRQAATGVNAKLNAVRIKPVLSGNG